MKRKLIDEKVDDNYIFIRNNKTYTDYLPLFTKLTTIFYSI